MSPFSIIFLLLRPVLLCCNSSGEVIAEGCDGSSEHPLHHALMVAIGAAAARDRRLWPLKTNQAGVDEEEVCHDACETLQSAAAPEPEGAVPGEQPLAADHTPGGRGRGAADAGGADNKLFDFALHLALFRPPSPPPPPRPPGKRQNLTVCLCYVHAV